MATCRGVAAGVATGKVVVQVKGTRPAPKSAVAVMVWVVRESFLAGGGRTIGVGTTIGVGEALTGAPTTVGAALSTV